MARGKYGEKAAKRQAELAVTNDLASYQHRVAKLTAENRDLREQLREQDRAAKQTERRLRAERDEGVAPQVEAIRQQVNSEKAKTSRRMQEIGRLLAHIFDDYKIKMHRAEFVELLGLLDLPMGALQRNDHEWNRNTRRAKMKTVRHVAELADSGRMGRTGGPGSKGPGA